MNTSFLLLTFVIIVIVILISDSITIALVIISLLANFLIISTYFDKLLVNKHAADSPSKETFEDVQDIASAPYPDPEYEQYDSYRDSYSLYDEPRPVPSQSNEYNYTVDSANAIMAQKRARDIKCSDGWASKTANYYKYHYADELDEAEKKPWWGNPEV